MATQTILIEDFAKEMERALRAVLPAHVKDIRVTPKSVCVFFDEKRGATHTSKSFGVDNRGYWTLRAIERSLTVRTLTETGRIHAYTHAGREGLARKAGDWFSQGLAEEVAQ